MSTPANRYSAPQAAVADVYSHDRAQAVRLWNPGGRMGRLHYIGYTVGTSLLLGAVLAALGALLGAFGGKGAMSGLLLGIGYLAYFVLFFQLTVQRCHDMNSSAWVSIVAIVPLVNLVFWFIPGSRGANRWGAPPVPGPRWAGVLAGVLVAVALVGILAAIALPNYQQYVQRAKAAQAK